jgi:hypothetical protein
MAREVTLKCDICRRSCKQIAAKLFFGPIIPGVNRAVHSNYTHHADVGECCEKRILELFNFKERLTAVEYHQSRRAGSK